MAGIRKYDYPNIDTDSISITIVPPKGVSPLTSVNLDGSVFVSQNGKGAITLTNFKKFISSITINSYRNGEPSKAQLTTTVGYLKDFGVDLGSIVRITYKDFVMFKGIVFERTINEQGQGTLICYDALYYLRNRCYYYIKKATHNAYDVLQQALTNVNYKDSFGSINISPKFKTYTYTLNRALVEYNKPIIDVLHNIINRWVVAGKAGNNTIDDRILIFFDYDKNTLNIITGSEAEKIEGGAYDMTSFPIANAQYGANLLDYEIKETITEDTYNQITALVEKVANADGEKNVITFNVKATQQAWGVLTKYYDFSYIDWNNQSKNTVIKKMCEGALKYYNVPKTTVTINMLGNPYLLAGKKIGLKIPNLGVISGGKNILGNAITVQTLVDTCSHSITNNDIRTSITVSTGIQYGNWLSIAGKSSLVTEG